MENLKQKTVSGIMWSAIERFSLQGVQFIIQIILARLLLPSDYGMIGMLAIFLQVAQVFIDSGFTNALIQKKDRTEEDFATVFYFNILVAVLFYGILFFSASLIADFYNMPTLVLVIRFIALSLIINALSAIHRTKLIISVNFKTQSKISLGAAFISGVIGIWMAYVGCGVWALVWQTLLNSIILTILFYCLVHWKPLHTFSKSSFERLFNFGSKLLISSLINTVYRNLYTIVIGKKFSVVELGYYTRAEQFAIFPSNNLNALVSRVAYPILSSIQDDDKCLTNAYELSHKGERDHGAERLLAAVGDEHVVALKAEHKAHEEARNRNDEERVVADEVDLLNDVAEPCAAQTHQKRPGEDPESADPAEESDHEAADCREELSHLSSPPKQASMLLAG